MYELREQLYIDSFVYLNSKLYAVTVLRKCNKQICANVQKKVRKCNFEKCANVMQPLYYALFKDFR